VAVEQSGGQPGGLVRLTNSGDQFPGVGELEGMAEVDRQAGHQGFVLYTNDHSV
jgi:hypothetical protein